VPLEYTPPPEVQNEGDVGQIGGIFDSRWSNFFDVSSGCTAEGVAASCRDNASAMNNLGVMRPNLILVTIRVTWKDPKKKPKIIQFVTTSSVIRSGFNHTFRGGAAVAAATAWNDGLSRGRDYALQSAIDEGFKREIEDRRAAQAAQNPGRLPFNSCDEFVSYLVKLADEAAKNVLGGLNPSTHYTAKNTLGDAMMRTAFFGYETHIHNGYEGFKPELTAHPQNAGIYGHILGIAGAYLAGPATWPIGAASDLIDRVQKMLGSEQGAAEVAGNKAGLEVGVRMSSFISDYGRDRHLLFDSIRSVLCE